MLPSDISTGEAETEKIEKYQDLKKPVGGSWESEVDNFG